METVVVGAGKSLLNWLLSGAKAAIDEDVGAKQGIQRDLTFLTEEQEAMQQFLREADQEENKEKVSRTRVKQMRELAYDVKDCLQDFVVHLKEPSWWHLPRTRLERHRIAEEMKGLRARVEDMSKRSSRYRILEDPAGSEPQRSSIVGAGAFGVDQASSDAMHDRAKMILIKLISKGEEDLRVISVWGPSGDLGQAPIVKGAYEYLKTHNKFQCYAWIKVMHPFNQSEFPETIARQLYADSLEELEDIQGSAIMRDQVIFLWDQVFRCTGTRDQDTLAYDLSRYLTEHSYLVVLDGLRNIEEWDYIKTFFPNNKRGSRIIVSAEQVEVASLSVGAQNKELGHKQLSSMPMYAFYLLNNSLGRAQHLIGVASVVYI